MAQMDTEENEGQGFGPYRLNMSIWNLDGLTEASMELYATMSSASPGERFYHAPSVMFLGQRWTIILVAVDDIVCRIVPILSLTNKELACFIAAKFYALCKEYYGVPDILKPGLFAWDAVDGAIMLNNDFNGREYVITIFLATHGPRSYQVNPPAHVPVVRKQANLAPRGISPTEYGDSPTYQQKLTLFFTLRGFAFLASLFAIYVWPTLYRYERVASASYDPYYGGFYSASVLKINRMTGETERIAPGKKADQSDNSFGVIILIFIVIGVVGMNALKNAHGIETDRK